MPNRIIRESICTSESIDQISWFEEVLFYRLIVNCDDFGRFDGRAAVIKSRLFPLKENITLKTVEAALHGLANAGLVTLYAFEGKRFLCLPTWSKYQTQRAIQSKYPSLESALQADENKCNQMQANDSACKQMISNVPVFENRESRIDIRYSRIDNSAEPQSASAPPLIALPLNDGTDFPVFSADCEEWAKLYPAVDVEQQLREMRGWLLANPSRRKTKKGISRFIVNWLAKEQDRGKPGKGGKSTGGDKNAWMDEYTD